MDRLWTPWRYNYITGAGDERTDLRKGVPEGLAEWPGEDQHCVFCNLIQSVRMGRGAADGPRRCGASGAGRGEANVLLCVS